MNDLLFPSRQARRRSLRQQLGKRNRWHTSVFSSSVAATTQTQLNAVYDSILRIDSNNGFLMPSDMLLMAAFGLGNLMNECNLQSPRIIQTATAGSYIRPVNASIELPANPSVAYYGPQWLKLRGQEDLLAYATNSGVGATQTSLVVFLSDMVEAIPPGEIYTVKATSTTAAVAYSWTGLTYSLTAALPAGLYALVGSDVVSTTAIAHRWTFYGQVLRPGFPSSTALGNNTWDGRRLRLLGQAGTFYQTNLPGLETFCVTTDNSHTIYLDLVKIG